MQNRRPPCRLFPRFSILHSSFCILTEVVTNSRYNPLLHRVALLLAAATFPLIFVGGLVTSHGAGLAVPDWPNSFGYNMFLFPPSQWVGNIWYEHVHRLYASGIGLLSIVLCVLAWRTDRRRGIRWLAVAVLGAVIFQGVLGGLRVIWIDLDLAVVHGCFAQAFFCLTALMAVVTSRWWTEAPDLSDEPDAGRGGRVVRWAAVAVVVIFGQLVVGAIMRHYRAGLAIPDFPLNYGKVLPPASWATLDKVQPPVWEGDKRTSFTLAQVWLQFGHRLGAIVVSVAILNLLVRVARLRAGRSWLLRPAWLLLGLLLTQLTLGALTVLLRKPADIASAHVAVGALTLMTTFVLTVRAVRLYWPRPVGERLMDSRAFEVLPAEPGAAAVAV
jgi:cytochrome c oxidase assembly protein subunit 15